MDRKTTNSKGVRPDFFAMMLKISFRKGRASKYKMWILATVISLSLHGSCTIGAVTTQTLNNETFNLHLTVYEKDG